MPNPSHDVHLFKSKLQEALSELRTFKNLDPENQIIVVDIVGEAAWDIVETYDGGD